MGLVSVAEARAFDGIESSATDAQIQMAVDSASRGVQNHCGRSFDTASTVTARTFRMASGWGSLMLPLGSEIATTTGLIVGSDDNDDGTYETTWLSTEFQLTPTGGIGPDGQPGWPYTEVAPIDRWWPTRSTYNRPLVQITARWGWLTVPANVELATLFLARELLPNIMLGYSGFSGGTTILPGSPVADLLMPFRRGAAVVGIG